jgi:hypothetical protein
MSCGAAFVKCKEIVPTAPYRVTKLTTIKAL